jgi:tetratricopeptide (TPR) repeat protein
MNRKLGIALFLIVATAGTLLAQAPTTELPLTEKEVIHLLKSKQPPAQAAALIQQRGVAFDLTPEIEKRLRKAKADDQFVELVKNAGPTARMQAAAAGIRLTPEEAQAFQAIQNELDPDRKIQLAADFAEKFPQSALVSEVYATEAMAYTQKNQFEKAVELGQESLQADPDNLRALLLITPILPEPQMLRGSELDKSKRLALTEDYAKHILELVDKLPRRPNETDEQLNQRKAELSALPHSALGMVHLDRAGMALQGMDRDELQKAEQEYQLAVTTTDRPTAQDYFRLGETRTMLNKLGEAIEAFSKASQLGEGTVIKTLADQKVEALKKAQASRPAKP